MSGAVELNINGYKLMVRSAEGEKHIRAVEDYLNHKIEEVKENSKAVSTLDLALLAALNVTGEVIKTREALEELERRSDRLSETIEESL